MTSSLEWPKLLLSQMPPSFNPFTAVTQVSCCALPSTSGKPKGLKQNFPQSSIQVALSSRISLVSPENFSQHFVAAFGGAGGAVVICRRSFAAHFSLYKARKTCNYLKIEQHVPTGR